MPRILLLLTGFCAALGCCLNATPTAAPITTPTGNRPPLPTLHLRSVTQFATTSPTGYSVRQIRHAYGFDQLSLTGKGQTIALVVAYGSSTLASDLAVFSNTYGLPIASLQIYYPQGKPAGSDSGWALETTLDAEWAHAIAPGANLAVVVASSSSLNSLLGAIDYAVRLGAKQISMSWGTAEFSGLGSLESHFNQPGVTFVAASGDAGSGAMWPAVSAYVVGVGGTTLQLDSAGNVLSELAWSGSGGGVSKYLARPAYQNGWNPYSGRGVPDVSYSADPNYGFPVYMSNYGGSTGWLNVGGTSCGTPQWAALFALANSGRATSLTSANSVLYSITSSAYTGDYRDILTGSNGGYDASILYDFVTGLGSPVAPKIVPLLVAATTTTAKPRPMNAR
ncbi:MAG: S53 family peptidase [Verrucomicrobia bacterium]|nr:S53 family peptidase [Verrucomicrobiota bacterium]